MVLCPILWHTTHFIRVKRVVEVIHIRNTSILGSRMSLSRVTKPRDWHTNRDFVIYNGFSLFLETAEIHSSYAILNAFHVCCVLVVPFTVQHEICLQDIEKHCLFLPEILHAVYLRNHSYLECSWWWEHARLDLIGLIWFDRSPIWSDLHRDALPWQI